AMIIMPSREPKRGLGEDGAESAQPKPKSRRLTYLPESRAPSNRHQLLAAQNGQPLVTQPTEPEEEPALPDEQEEQMDAVLDEAALKKLILNFEKKILKNQELRIKFPEFPEKFMDSELELHDVIQELHVVATQPDLYHVLVELNSVASLLGLLSHDNSGHTAKKNDAFSMHRAAIGRPLAPAIMVWLHGVDHSPTGVSESSLARLLTVPSRSDSVKPVLRSNISIAVVDLLQEMTDVDTLHESQEGAALLVQALLEGQVVALLVQNMERLEETVKEEADGVHNSLGVIENLAEFKPQVCVDAGQQGLISWLLRRLKAKIPFDANKLYASEILSILLQNHEENCKLVGEQDGIDVLLQQLAHFKRHNPTSLEEEEMMENLFNCLCCSLLYLPNRERFLQGEGLQLMNLMLREKKQSRSGALKVLDFAMGHPGGSDNCNKFVDILGLRTIFPLFMKTPKKSGRKKVMSTEEHEEHTCSIISSMLKACKGTQRQRLLNKFTENDHEKVDRLMELHFKYLEKVQAVDRELEQDDLSEEEAYLRRLDRGLFSLQLLDYIMVDICSSGSPSIKQRVHQILNLRGGSIKTIRNVMREYAGNLGDDKDDPAFKELEQQRILQLIDRF
ncbi:CTNNBL1, partial [Cordylochernes scorpioides]